MNDQQHLLWVILDEPEVDLHRLVFADWLEENGQDARAEFIRVQLQLALMKQPWCKAKSRESSCEELRLSRENWCDWCSLRWGTEHDLFYKRYGWHEWTRPAFTGMTYDGGISIWKGPCTGVRVTLYDAEKNATGEFRCHYARGFISEVHCTLSDWLKHVEQIIPHHPVEQVVTEKKPYWNGSGHSWFRADRDYPADLLESAELPDAVYWKLEHPWDSAIMHRWKPYHTEQAALDALDAVLVGEWRKREQESRKIAYVSGE